jgi:hypothetical protein
MLLVIGAVDATAKNPNLKILRNVCPQLTPPRPLQIHVIELRSTTCAVCHTCAVFLFGFLQVSFRYYVGIEDNKVSEIRKHASLSHEENDE